MKRATLRYLPPYLLTGSLTALVLMMVAAATGCAGVSGGGSSTPPPPPPPPNLSVVKHIIFLAEENRSFDHYFGKMNDYRSARAV